MKKEKSKVACPQCGKEIAPWAMRMHMTIHKAVPEPSADLSDITGKLEKAGARIKELEAQLADVKPAPQAELGEDQRLAVLGDWLDSLTKEAWAKIGEEAGYFDQMSETKTPAEAEPAGEPTATLSDAGPKPDPLPATAPNAVLTEKPAILRRVYFPDTGLVFKVLVKKMEARQ